MKVVLFCGGFGTRLREYSTTIPKPLVNVGSRPIVWHLMRYYAHFGHTEFVLCLGYLGETIKEYFLNYDARMSDDFVLAKGETRLLEAQTDVPDWTIHFVDSGVHANVGKRLHSIQPLLEGEPSFLVNYADQLTDLPLDDYLAAAQNQNCIASLVSVRPYGSYHTIEIHDSGRVKDIRAVDATEHWINGGYMLLKQEIFDYLRPGEELVEEPFRRLVEQQQLFAYRYTGFWKAMDTYKDKLFFDEMIEREERPWEVWKS